MKIKEIIITITVGVLIVGFLMLATPLVAQSCQIIEDLGYCAGSSGQGANCGNGCVSISYTPEYQEICVDVDENGCGNTGCQSPCVNCWETIYVETGYSVNGVCIGCGLPEVEDLQPAGQCNTAYFQGGTQCGNCN